MNILVISNNYPSSIRPNYGAFVYNLVQEMSKSHEITVISAFKIDSFLKTERRNYGDERCTVYRPNYISFSNKTILGIDLGRVSSWSYSRAVNRVLNLIKKPDVIYAHFLNNAKPVISYAEKNDIPLVVASGESSYTFWNKIPHILRTRLQRQINHIVCVSNENRQKLIQIGFDPKRLTVIPNAVDHNLFKSLDKVQCRKKLGVSASKFTVGFIGHFIHRKGPNRIIDALKFLNDSDIQLVCVGNNGQLTANSFTTEIDPVPNFRLPEIYNAFDVFVLPTLSEGHCNVIEEAKACAIPVISSKGTSVEGQINGSTGILIDPLNINEIAEAILELKNNEERRASMRNVLMEKRGENSLEERASKISHLLAAQI